MHVASSAKGRALLGLVIGDKAMWRKGIASLNLHKIRTRAFQKAGYRESGTQREEMFRDGRFRDIWMGEVLREDWERAPAEPKR